MRVRRNTTLGTVCLGLFSPLQGSSPEIRQCLKEEELCKTALTCHFALDDYLCVHGVVTNRGGRPLGEIGEGAHRVWPVYLSSHGIGKLHWKGEDIATTCENVASTRNGSPHCPLESGYVVFTPRHIAHTGSPRSGLAKFGREALQRLVKRAMGTRMVHTVSRVWFLLAQTAAWYPLPTSTSGDWSPSNRPLVNLEGARAGRPFALEPLLKCVKRHVDGEPYLETLEKSAKRDLEGEDMEIVFNKTSCIICTAASIQSFQPPLTFLSATR